MSTLDAIRSTFALSDMVLNSYVGDFRDSDLMTRPGIGCNHIAWQLGHLISSEADLIDKVKAGSAVALPDGFADKHSKEATANDDANDFCSQAEYVALYKQTRENSLSVISSLPEESFSAEGPEDMRQFCPTMADFCCLIASHPMMHVGQFVPVRRAHGKPIVI